MPSQVLTANTTLKTPVHRYKIDVKLKHQLTALQ